MPSRLAGVSVPALALLVSPVGPQGTPPAIQVGIGLTVALPDGWSVAREAPGHGVVLQPPEEGAPPVDVAMWRVSVGVDGPIEAAAEHERILSSRVRYDRMRLEPIASPNAGEGVFVEGSVLRADGSQAVALFAVFARGARACVMGTFVDPEDAASARRKYLDPIIERLTLTAPLGGTAPSKPTPPEPETEAVDQPEPAAESTTEPKRAGELETELPVPPGREQVGQRPPGSETQVPSESATQPEPRRDETPAYERQADPLGFSLALPPGWEYAVRHEAVTASSPAGATVCLLPMTCSSGPLGRLTREEMLRRCVRPVEGVRLVSSEVDGSANGAIWFDAALEADGQPLSGRFALVVDSGDALLAGVIASEDELAAQLPAAAEVIASFRASFAAPDTSERERNTTWADATGALRCAPPNGWVLDGSVGAYDKQPIIQVHGTSADGSGAWFAWAQPLRPIFRELTAAMRRLGFRDGDPYYAYDGVDPRIVMTRGSAGDLLTRHLLAKGVLPGGSKAVVVSEAPIDGLAFLGRPGEQATLVTLAEREENPGRRAWCLLSDATFGESRGGWFWDVAFVAFGGAPERCGEAARALRETIRSASVAPGTDLETRAALETLIGRSVSACGASLWDELVGDVVFTPALHVGGSGAPGGRTYSAPPAATAAWLALARSAPDVGDGASATASAIGADGDRPQGEGYRDAEAR